MEMRKSEQIRAGLQKSFQSGTSAKASTVCYGYKVTQSGELLIDSAEAKVVTFIFRQFMNGNSLGKIFDALARMGIFSPTGRATWSREIISKLLSNEKYVDDVVPGMTQIIDGVQVKSHDHSMQAFMREHHPAIVSYRFFHIVQQEKRKRQRQSIYDDRWC